MGLNEFSDQRVGIEERVITSSLRACIHSQKSQVNWHTVIKMCQMFFLVLMPENSLT